MATRPNPPSPRLERRGARLITGTTWRWLKTVAARLSALAPLLVLIALYAAGAGMIVAGVGALFGESWGLIAAGGFTMAAGYVVARGMVA